jgi:hypothetical protein
MKKGIFIIFLSWLFLANAIGQAIPLYKEYLGGPKENEIQANKRYLIIEYFQFLCMEEAYGDVIQKRDASFLYLTSILDLNSKQYNQLRSFAKELIQSVVTDFSTRSSTGSEGTQGRPPFLSIINFMLSNEKLKSKIYRIGGIK